MTPDVICEFCIPMICASRHKKTRRNTTGKKFEVQIRLGVRSRDYTQTPDFLSFFRAGSLRTPLKMIPFKMTFEIASQNSLTKNITPFWTSVIQSHLQISLLLELCGIDLPTIFPQKNFSNTTESHLEISVNPQNLLFLRHNCCSFARALVKKLGVRSMPSWVDRLATRWVSHQVTDGWGGWVPCVCYRFDFMGFITIF